MVAFTDFNRKLAFAAAIALFDRLEPIEDFSIFCRAQELDVFGMRPGQWHGGTGGAAETHSMRGKVGPIPDLLGQHATGGGEPLHGSDHGANVVPGGELVVRAFACQQWPGAALPPAFIGTAVMSLTVAVVVVTPPAGAKGSVD